MNVYCRKSTDVSKDINLVTHIICLWDTTSLNTTKFYVCFFKHIYHWGLIIIGVNDESPLKLSLGGIRSNTQRLKDDKDKSQCSDQNKTLYQVLNEMSAIICATPWGNYIFQVP